MGGHLKGGLGGIQQAGIQADHRAALGLLLLKADHIVLKGRLLVHRNVEPRVPAHHKGHGPVSPVLHGEGGGVAGFRQSIGNRESKAEGIAFLSLLVGCQLQREEPLPLLCRGKFLVPGEAVPAHFHPPAL